MSRTARQKPRRSSTLGAALNKMKTRMSSLTHDIIDPYVTIRLSTSGVTHTTKPVRDGGATCRWASKHDNVLVFDYPFEPQRWSCSLAEQIIQDDARNVPGRLSVHVFDQDLMMDAHIGGAELRMDDVFESLGQIADELDDAYSGFGAAESGVDFCLPGGARVRVPVVAAASAASAASKGNGNNDPAAATAAAVSAAEHEREITLHRRHDHHVSGFLSLRVRFVKEGTHSRADGTSFDVGKLIITVESASDLWDPNDLSDWIPDDPHTGTSLCSSLVITLLYFGIGAAFYCLIEGWLLIDALYFAVVTFTTVGYGDVKPLLDSTKLFTCVYMIVGISMVAISIIRLCLAMYDWVSAFAAQFHGCREHAKHMCLHTKDKRQRLKRVASHRRVMTLVQPGDLRSGNSGGNGAVDGNNWDGDGDGDANGNSNSNEDNNGDQENKSLRSMILRMLFTVTLLVAVGTIFFVAVEDMTFVDACYMSTATVATVGYGDIAPVTQGGRFFAVIWITLSYGMLARSLHLVVDGFHEKSLETQRLKVLNRDLSRASIINMDKDGDGKLSRLEFLSHMVVKLKLCRENQLDKIMERFDEIEESRIARERVMHHVATGSDADFDEAAAMSHKGNVATTTPGTETKSTPPHHDHPLAGMLAHLRRAAEYGRTHVETETRNGRVNEAKAAVRSYRMILELLHKQETSNVHKIHADGKTWSVPSSPPPPVRVNITATEFGL
jgi:hypothetical protein